MEGFNTSEWVRIIRRNLRHTTMKEPVYTPKEVTLHLKTLPDWGRRGLTLGRTFRFAGFPDSIEFVKRVARAAEKSNHHPDIDIRFNKVTLTLTTHDAGGITGKDFALARLCDAAGAKVGARNS
ncbi:MAG: hypothetical protein RIS76_3996 [Verrucomicrobiota bacterium]|jgi:4a-hydroxytetrahydrobiopterin dehydratase